MRVQHALRTRPPVPGATAASSKRLFLAFTSLTGLMGRASAADRQHQHGQQHLGSSRSNSSSLACPAYVGQQNPLAGEYHSRDFDWHEHAQQTAELLGKQWAAAPAAVQQAAQLSEETGQPLSAVAAFLQSLQRRHQHDSSKATSSCQHSNPGAAVTQHQQHLGCADSTDQQQQAQHIQPELQPQYLQQQAEEAAPVAASVLQAAPCQQPGSSNEWEVFYRAHPSARFYKERRYLLLEFPCLAPPAQLQHVVEIGAGCGSSILPVMRAQPQAQVTVCDVSATCLQQLQGAMQLLGLEPQLCSCFVADGTDPGLGGRLAACAADVALIMFTLSAVEPAGMLVMMQNAAASLRPGGLLCVRDHALYDMVQLRIPAEQCIGRHIYKRGDGTLAYFYTTEELAGLATAAGLEVVECEYVCVFNRNRKTGLELRRTFVHGVFRRPLQ